MRTSCDMCRSTMMVGVYEEMYGKFESIAKLEIYGNNKAETYIPCFCVNCIAVVAISARCRSYLSRPSLLFRESDKFTNKWLITFGGI